MDPLSLGVGALVFVGGMFLGRVRRPKAPEPRPHETPMCGCEHHYGAHEAGGKCRVEVRRADKWERYNTRTGETYPTHYSWVPCPCLVYDGPEPLPRTWLPPELWPGDLKEK